MESARKGQAGVENRFYGDFQTLLAKVSRVFCFPAMIGNNVNGKEQMIEMNAAST
jgi:hypothetical protein